MKKYIILAVIAGVIVFVGSARGEPEPVSVRMTHTTDAGVVRYDLHVEDYTLHFWGKDQLEQFASQIDEDDPELTVSIRKIVKVELESGSIDQVVSDLERGMNYTFTRESINRN
jgi:hypothetical protein